MSILAETPIRTEKSAKEERIEVRLSTNAKSLLTAAAKIRQTTVSEFVLTKGIEAAEEVLADRRVFFASEADWERVLHFRDMEDASSTTTAAIKWLNKKRGRTR
ncbi:type II toxin-antitoxin system TacA family antitoxin [Novacetimonas hansenii]|uniref:type II toxin-antitoxin system TacA family antitoxin n=1 Tax=Novacetimonas hansenii TaxID=436 RepID=UPI0009BD53F9|nr:DUF1778 domain-containing protein [Novacetimonas hansenii]WEQ58291.1 DUF1778 domain-containing protein [Novacetimonas hansenii]